MALSYCSNWGTALQHLNPDITTFQQTQLPDIAPELLAAFQEEIAFADTCIDPLFSNSNDFLCSDNFTTPLFHSAPSLPEIFPPQEFETCRFPKLQKIYEDHYYPDFRPNFFDNGYMNNTLPNSFTLIPEFSPEFLLPGVQFPPVYAPGIDENNVTKPSEGSLSTQSIAARQRRRKITEKTQELGKLIPGGNKMNTAEMFSAAFKYIKYLQAQVGMLELIGSIQPSEESQHVEGLQVLVASPPIQEKLYSEEKCLVPKQFVQALSNDRKVQSNSLILKDINQLMNRNEG